MSWIKGQLNKLFMKETYEEIEEYEEDNKVPIHDHRQTPMAQQKRERNATFRFPLISDDEAVPVQQTQTKQPVQQRREENDVFELPKHLQPHGQSQVYDVEVSGIRELLERRQKGRGYSNVIRSSEVKERVSRVSAEEKVSVTKSPVREPRKVDQEFISPLANRKKFVPTNVPSPVYGFNKPKSIETLLNRHPENVHNEPVQEEVVAQSIVEQAPSQSIPVEEIQTPPMVEEVQEASVEKETIEVQQIEEQETLPKVVALVEIEPAVSQIQLEEDEETVVETPVEIAPSYYESIEEPAILAEEVTEAPLNDVQVKHITVENSTIHIGQLHVEHMPQAEIAATVVEQTQSNLVDETVEQPPVQEHTGSKLPFNVLMLKSDKQKLIARQMASQQFRTAIPQVEGESVEENKVEELTDTCQLNMDGVETTVTLANSTIIMDEPNIALSEVNEVSEPNVELEEELPELNQVVSEPIAEPSEPKEVSETKLELSEPKEELPQLNQVVSEPIAEPSEPKEVSEPKLELSEPKEEISELNQVVSEPIAEPSEPKVESNDPILQELELPPEKPVRAPYVKPPLDFLMPPEEMLEDREWMEEQGERLVEALSYFQVTAQIESIVQGPAVTQFEITVGQGTKVSKVRNLSDDIKLALAARDIRIDAPIPGKRSIGIEIPNRISRAVRLSEVTDSAAFQDSDSPLEAALGLDLTGKPVTIDLRKMPHGLIAGATGSGKSVCINSILVSLLYKADPSELKLMLIDPKMVELAPFNHIPHLVSPVITDVKAATAALKWAVEEMERRYQLFMHSGARHITGYNKLCEDNKQYAQKLPYMLIVIDELADLMMMSPQDVEDAISRIAQKARACGIHLIVATQRPSVDVITGTIKSNIPTRIAFAVSSQIDSRTIIDTAGADRLLGRGDMLYLGNGMSAPTRIQGTFVTDEEIEEIVEYVREQGEPDYIFQQDELLKKAEAIEEQDELFEEVCRFVYEQGTASTSSLQRRYHIGYNRAARLIDMLEGQGYVSEQKGSKPRDVFITETDLAIQFGD